MIISKTNDLLTNSLAVIAGSVLSGNISYAKDPNFGLTVSSSSSTFTFVCGAANNVDYIALHGVTVPVGGVVTVSGSGYSDSYTSTSIDDRNIVFYLSSPVNIASLQISITGSGIKRIGFIAAGQAATVPHGTSAGQDLYYLGYNAKSRTSVNEQGAPVLRTQVPTAPKLRITIKNVLKSWVRDDFKAITTLYARQGVLSILDYEDDGRPNESVAGFELDGVDVKTHSQTLALVDVSFNVRVSV